MATKKTEDYTKAKQAETLEDVQGQDTATKIWQSLAPAYDQQVESIEEGFRQSEKQLNNNVLSRGLQRSSLAAQSLGNLLAQKNKQITNAGKERIASLQSALLQAEEAENARKFQTAEREATQNWQAGQNEIARAFEGEQARLGREFEGQQNALNREQSNTQFNLNLDFQKAEAERAQKNTDIAQAFAEKQWDEQVAQWNKQYDADRMDAQQQKAYNYILQAVKAGGDVTDEMLAEAGISRQDYNAMKGATLGGSTGSTGGTPYWASLGFSSEKDYGAARRAGLTAAQYYGSQETGGEESGNMSYTELMNALNGANVSRTPTVKPALTTKKSSSTGPQAVYLDGPIAQEFLDYANQPSVVSQTGRYAVSTLQEQQKKDKQKNSGK